MHLARILICGFVLLGSGAWAFDEKCIGGFLALGRPRNFAPFSSVNTLIREVSRATRASRQDGLIRYLHAAQTLTPAPLTVPIVRAARVHPDVPVRVLTDKRGREYLAISNEPTYPIVLMSVDGRPVAVLSDKKSLEEIERPARPHFKRKYRTRADELATYLLSPPGREPVPFSVIQIFRDPEFEAALEQGVAFRLDTVVGHVGPVEGTVYTTLYQGRPVYAVELSTARRTYTLINETGQSITVDEAVWKRHVEPHIPGLDVASTRDVLVWRWLGQYYQRRQYNLHTLRSTGSFVPLALFYPYLVPFRFGMGLYKLFKGERPSTTRDRKALAAFLLLLLTDMHPGQWALSDILEDLDEDPQDLSIDVRAFWSQAENNLGKPPQGTILFIDGMPDSDVLARAAEVMHMRLLGLGRDTRLVRANNVEEAVRAIAENYEQTGKRIGMLVFFGHGDVLRGEKNDTPLSVLVIGSDMVSLDAQATQSRLLEYERLTRKRISDSGLPYEVFSPRMPTAVGMDSVPNLQDAFLPNAQLRFISCNIAHGECGDHFVDEWATKTITAQGGSVASATIPISVPWDLQHPQTFERNLEKRKEQMKQVIEALGFTGMLKLTARQLAVTSIAAPGAMLYYPIHWWRHKNDGEDTVEVMKTFRYAPRAVPQPETFPAVE